jgi:hypothetical protein
VGHISRCGRKERSVVALASERELKIWVALSDLRDGVSEFRDRTDRFRHDGIPILVRFQWLQAGV